MELVSNLALRLESVWPMDNGAVPGSAPVRGDLLGPLVRGVHGMGPPDGVVVVSLRRAEFIDARRHELGCLELARPVEHQQLVERPLQRAFRRRPVVADHAVDEGVLEKLETLEGIEQPPDVVVGVLHEPGVDLHLSGEHRLEVVGHVVPRWDLVGPSGELGVIGDHSEFLLPGDDLLTQHDPTPDRTCPGTCRTTPWAHGAVRGCPRGVVDEEGLVRGQRLLLADPLDCTVGHVLGEVVALLGGAIRLNRHRVPVDGRGVLVGLTTDEPVEVLEAVAR